MTSFGIKLNILIPFVGSRGSLSKISGSHSRTLFTCLPFSITSTSWGSQLSTFAKENQIKMHSEKSTVDLPNYRVITIPATADNFMYLVIDKSTLQAFVVDPVEPESVLDVARRENVTLNAILTTHHHWDHAGGNKRMVDLYKRENGDGSAKLEVYGGDDRIEALTIKVSEGEEINIGRLRITCRHTPCHTTGHICFYLQSPDINIEPPSVFTGDTLFVSGCGKFFEGNPAEMYTALIDKLGKMPEQTLVFCGHEYTVNNLKFALSVDPQNNDMKEKLNWAEGQRSHKLPTVPSTIGAELKCNPFMRVNNPLIQNSLGTNNGIGAMGALRAMKDNFKG